MPTDSKKRSCHPHDEMEANGEKRKRIRFSEESNIRFFEENETFESEDDCYKHQDAIQNSKPSESDQVPVVIFEPCQKFNVEIFDNSIKTKTDDGPAPGTLATQSLIRFLLKQKSISTSQVLDILKTSVPDIRTQSKCMEEFLGVGGDDQRKSMEETLCLDVIHRLQTLCTRIESRGKASILPCTTSFGQPFLPAIRFLISSASRRLPPRA